MNGMKPKRMDPSDGGFIAICLAKTVVGLYQKLRQGLIQIGEDVFNVFDSD